MKILKEIKDRFMAIRWFYDVCHNKKFTFSFSTTLWPCWQGDPKEIFSPEKMMKFMENLDPESCRVLLNFAEKMTVDLNCRSYHFNLSYPPFTPETEKFYSEYQKKEKLEYQKKGISVFYEESAYYHHGMRFLPESVKNYVKDKIFIDGGAYMGDSSLMFLQYTPKKVYAFDISPENSAAYRKIMNRNQVSTDEVELIQKGLGEKQEKIYFSDGKGEGTSLTAHGKTEAEIIPLDSCKEVDGTVGWIKIDLEGYGLPAVKGMVETIKRDRPVLTLAVYHCADELFGIKALIESLDLNYKMMFRSCHFDGYHELTLIAYPAELDI